MAAAAASQPNAGQSRKEIISAKRGYSNKEIPRRVRADRLGVRLGVQAGREEVDVDVGRLRGNCKRPHWKVCVHICKARVVRTCSNPLLVHMWACAFACGVWAGWGCCWRAPAATPAAPRPPSWPAPTPSLAGLRTGQASRARSRGAHATLRERSAMRWRQMMQPQWQWGSERRCRNRSALSAQGWTHRCTTNRR